MMENEIMMILFCSITTFVIGFCLGHTVLHKDAWLLIDRISQWIDDTNSNKWIQYSMYEDLEEKYELLLREHEQYRGTMKAINDCRKKYNDGDVDD